MILQHEDNLADIRKNRQEYTNICKISNKALLFCLDNNDNYPVYQLDMGSTKSIYALNNLHGTIEGFVEFEIKYAPLLNINWITNMSSWRVG